MTMGPNHLVETSSQEETKSEPNVLVQPEVQLFASGDKMQTLAVPNSGLSNTEGSIHIPTPSPIPSDGFYDPDLVPAPAFILNALALTPIPRSGKTSPAVHRRFSLHESDQNSGQILFDPRLNALNHQTKFPKPVWPKTPPTIPTSYFKDYHRSKKKNSDLIFADIVRPAPVVRRPFESLGNPYPQACSKLCNHPINSALKKEYKEVIKKAKDTWGNEGRTLLLPEEELLLRNEMSRLRATSSIDDQDMDDDDVNSCDSSSLPRPDLDDDEDRIPEELLLKYTKPDSPTHYSLSPTARTGPPSAKRKISNDRPTSASQKSSGRRCQTPDQLPPSDEKGKRKIVLDLRRTKSTENLYIPDPLEMTESEDLVSASKTEELSQLKKEQQEVPVVVPSRKGDEGTTSQGHSTTVVIVEDSAGPARKEQVRKDTAGTKGSPPQASSPTSKPKKMRKDSGSGGPGKKSKKKFARHKIRSDSPDKDVFAYDLEDPGETQVATSGVSEVKPRVILEGQAAESGNEPGNLLTAVESIDTIYTDSQLGSNANSTFQDDPLERRALLSLEKQLELEEPVTEYDIRRLQEVDDRLIKTVRHSMGRNTSGVEAEIKELEKELALPGKANESLDDFDESDFWLNLPRTFSYQSSRFELPLDMSQMANMTPLDYLSRYVSVSSARRQLYNKVYVRHRSLKDGMLTDEATIKSLEEVIGSPFTDDQKKRLWKQLNITLKPHILTVFTFRQFSGIAAMVERLFRSEFASTTDTQKRPVEHKSEIEVADFDRLLSKLELIDVAPPLKDLLIKIKDSGIPKVNAQFVAGGQILTRRRSRFDFL